MVLVLAAAGAAALLLKKFMRFRESNPEGAQVFTSGVNGAATVVAAAAQVVIILLKALWGQPTPVTATAGTSRIGQIVGDEP